jgi:hypothetical protein
VKRDLIMRESEGSAPLHAHSRDTYVGSGKHIDVRLSALSTLILIHRSGWITIAPSPIKTDNKGEDL